MSRSPLFYPLNRGMDAEAGGAADLQTDVMRFMAILALCLMAIFALVQSIPLAPKPVTPVEQAPSEPPARLVQIPAPVEEPSVRPAAEVPIEIEPSAPEVEPESLQVEATPETKPEPIQVRVNRPEPVRANPVEVPDPEPAPATPERQGFTLRFDTDSALTSLVARNEVGLYAIGSEKSLRMSVNRGQSSFWAASLPKQFHEMDATTVPDSALSALVRSGSFSAGETYKWAVTLPASMRKGLDQIVASHAGGELIITANGNIQLEQ